MRYLLFAFIVSGCSVGLGEMKTSSCKAKFEYDCNCDCQEKLIDFNTKSIK